MGKFLYIGNSYISNLNELVDIVLQSKGSESLQNEIKSLFMDEVITDWLRNGGDNEKKMADQIAAISKESTGVVILNGLGEIITGQQLDITKNYKKYFYIYKQYYQVGTNNKVVPFSDIISRSTVDGLSIELSFIIVCSKAVDECFSFSLKKDGSLVGETKIVNLANLVEGKEYRIVFSNIHIPAMTVYSVFELFVDNSIVETFRFTGEDKLKISFTISDGTKMEFNMIKVCKDVCLNMWDDERFAIPNDFYIAEFPVTRYLWNHVIGYNPTLCNDDKKDYMTSVSYNDCIRFIRKINDLTGWEFRLPTEKEWVAAAWLLGRKNKIKDMEGNIRQWCTPPFIEYSNDEDMHDNRMCVLRGGKQRYSQRFFQDKSAGCARFDFGFRLCL